MNMIPKSKNAVDANSISPIGENALIALVETDPRWVAMTASIERAERTDSDRKDIEEQRERRTKLKTERADKRKQAREANQKLRATLDNLLPESKNFVIGKGAIVGLPGLFIVTIDGNTGAPELWKILIDEDRRQAILRVGKGGSWWACDEEPVNARQAILDALKRNAERFPDSIIHPRYKAPKAPDPVTPPADSPAQVFADVATAFYAGGKGYQEFQQAADLFVSVVNRNRAEAETQEAKRLAAIKALNKD